MCLLRSIAFIHLIEFLKHERLCKIYTTIFDLDLSFINIKVTTKAKQRLDLKRGETPVEIKIADSKSVFKSFSFYFLPLHLSFSPLPVQSKAQPVEAGKTVEN